MIENKSLGSKIFDILNVVILIAVTLICIVPVWYVLCVSLSSREAVNAGQVALWPVGFNLLSYKKIMGETAFFGSFLVSIKRVLLGTGISMVCILMAAFPLSRTKKQFPKRDIFMWIFVFCMLFNGGTVPWYITMKNYNLMDNIFGLVLGTGWRSQGDVISPHSWLPTFTRSQSCSRTAGQTTRESRYCLMQGSILPRMHLPSDRIIMC